MRRLLLPIAVLALSCGGVPEDEGTPETSVELVDEAVAETDAVEAQKADVAGLTSAQAKMVLTALDNVCGDTWCEGDFSWHFKRITCNFGLKRCTLTIFITDAYGDGQEWWRSARITGLTSYKSLMDGSELRETFYDKVNTAVGRIETKLQGG